MKKQLAHYQTRLTKLLLAIALFCNFFIFSGYASNTSATKQHQSIQTELVDGFKHKNKARILSFNRTIFAPDTHTACVSETSKTAVRLTYNHLMKVKFDNLSKRFNTIPIALRFFQLKTIPQSSEEDITIV
jgi:hypothetical protein